MPKVISRMPSEFWEFVCNTDFCLSWKLVILRPMKYITSLINACPLVPGISCAHFQSFSDAIKHIVDWKIELTLFIRVPSTTNYLDDFLFAAFSWVICTEMVNIFLKICQQISCPIANEKTEWVTQIIDFLGILLNGRTLTLIIPTDKRISAINLLLQAIQDNKVTVKFVQKLTGTLNFLHRAIISGWAFT